MASRGETETETLHDRIQGQLNRLIVQLQDLEDLKEEITQEEYESMKEDTMKQMEEFQEQLERFKTGNMTLIDDINAMQIGIREAIAQAFKTPEVIRMFAQRQPDALRQKLEIWERDLKLGKLSQQDYNAKRHEVLIALKKLDCQLSPEENDLVINMSSAGDRIEAREGDVDADLLLSQARANLNR